MRKVGKVLENPKDLAVKEAKKVWSLAISRVDAHSLKCKSCNKRRQPHDLSVKMGVLNDPKLEAYQLCETGIRLYADERSAIAAYRNLGGKL